VGKFVAEYVGKGFRIQIQILFSEQRFFSLASLNYDAYSQTAFAIIHF